LNPDSRSPLPPVVFVTAELAPFATSGGLGDVSRALPRALAALGHQVSVGDRSGRGDRTRGGHVSRSPALGADRRHGHGRGFFVAPFGAPLW
jgi:glycosyl transferase family 5 (putative starch synthase catalytic subunit)